MSRPGLVGSKVVIAYTKRSVGQLICQTSSAPSAESGYLYRCRQDRELQRQGRKIVRARHGAASPPADFYKDTPISTIKFEPVQEHASNGLYAQLGAGAIERTRLSLWRA